MLQVPTSKDPSCSEIEVIIRDFESGPGVFADDGAFAFGSRRDIMIELGARILYDHCVRWGMMPHTAGKTVAMYFGQGFFHERLGLMGGLGRMAAGGRQTCHSTVC